MIKKLLVLILAAFMIFAPLAANAKGGGGFSGGSRSSFSSSRSSSFSSSRSSSFSSSRPSSSTRSYSGGTSSVKSSTTRSYSGGTFSGASRATVTSGKAITSGRGTIGTRSYVSPTYRTSTGVYFSYHYGSPYYHPWYSWNSGFAWGYMWGGMSHPFGGYYYDGAYQPFSWSGLGMGILYWIFGIVMLGFFLWIIKIIFFRR